jgi:hypothetical protein
MLVRKFGVVTIDQVRLAIRSTEFRWCRNQTRYFVRSGPQSFRWCHSQIWYLVSIHRVSMVPYPNRCLVRSGLLSFGDAKTKTTQYSVRFSLLSFGDAATDPARSAIRSTYGIRVTHRVVVCLWSTYITSLLHPPAFRCLTKLLSSPTSDLETKWKTHTSNHMVGMVFEGGFCLWRVSLKLSNFNKYSRYKHDRSGMIILKKFPSSIYMFPIRNNQAWDQTG